MRDNPSISVSHYHFILYRKSPYEIYRQHPLNRLPPSSPPPPHFHILETFFCLVSTVGAAGLTHTRSHEEGVLYAERDV